MYTLHCDTIEAATLIKERQVLVFRTSVSDARDVERLRPWLDEVARDGRWTFDLEDRDRVLRVETSRTVEARVSALLTGLGFICDELE